MKPACINSEPYLLPAAALCQRRSDHRWYERHSDLMVALPPQAN